MTGKGARLVTAGSKLGAACTRWFKYDRDICGLFTHKSVPVIFEPPCIKMHTVLGQSQLGQGSGAEQK